MAKQEKIKEGIARTAYYFENRGKECIVWEMLSSEHKTTYYGFADVVLMDEASQGVVLKVDIGGGYSDIEPLIKK